jgi:stage II sporulation protein M
MKKSFFKKNYSLCWDYMKDFRWYTVGIIGVFVLFFLIGFILPIFYVEEILEIIREISLSIEGKGVFELVVFIFLNNLGASFYSVFFGVFFGIVPLFSSVFNGYLIGFVSRGAVEIEGLFVLWRLFPHGIFELPAVFLSMAMGLKLGLGWFSKKGRKNFKKNFKESMRFFFFVVLPLLLIAGIIEGILVVLVG